MGNSIYNSPSNTSNTSNISNTTNILNTKNNNNNKIIIQYLNDNFYIRYSLLILNNDKLPILQKDITNDELIRIISELEFKDALDTQFYLRILASFINTNPNDNILKSNVVKPLLTNSIIKIYKKQNVFRLNLSTAKNENCKLYQLFTTIAYFLDVQLDKEDEYDYYNNDTYKTEIFLYIYNQFYYSSSPDSLSFYIMLVRFNILNHIKPTEKSAINFYNNKNNIEYLNSLLEYFLNFKSKYSKYSELLNFEYLINIKLR